MSTTVSGNLKDLTTVAVSTNCFVRFNLRGCNGAQARVNGTALVPPQSGTNWYQDFVPNASGVISGTIYSNDVDIDTTLTPGGHGTWYGVVIYNNGVQGPETPYLLADATTFNLNNATPITTIPVITTPTGDSTYLRLDGGNLGSAVNPYPFPGVLAAATGFRRTGGTHTAGRVLRANGTNFVDAVLAAADLSDGTNGTGSICLSNSPTLVTPNIGAATATSVNGLHLASSTGTLSVVNGKTLTIDNSLEFAGTDGVKHTLSATTPAGGVLSYGRPTVQVFTANGTLTIATGVTALKCTVIGGGGAGGGSTATINGGGGGSGGLAIKWLTGLTPGNTIVVTVGGGGTGVSTGNGNSGNASSIASGTQTITTVTANGGGGGFASGAASAGGASATVSTNGDINGAGAPGHTAYASNIGGTGGSTFLGGGGQPAGGGGSSGNNAVANTGSGGSGNGAGINGSGGNGAAGIVIFEWVA